MTGNRCESSPTPSHRTHESVGRLHMLRSLLNARALSLITVVLIAIAGCTNDGSTGATDDDAYQIPEGFMLQDLEDEGPSAIPLPPQPTATAEEGPRHTLVVHRLLYNRRAPRLALALEQTVHTDTLPVELRQLWHANGFGIGRVDRHRLPLLLANLPEPRGGDVFRIETPSREVPLRINENRREDHRLLLTESPGQPEVVEVPRGRYQFFVRLTPSSFSELGKPHLRIVPHHHAPRPSVVPRSPLKRQRDGRLFSALRISEPMTPQDVWIIWWRAAPRDGTPDPTAGPYEVPDAADGDGMGEIGDELDDLFDPFPPGSTDGASPFGPRLSDLAEAMLCPPSESGTPEQVVLMIGLERK